MSHVINSAIKKKHDNKTNNYPKRCQGWNSKFNKVFFQTSLLYPINHQQSRNRMYKSINEYTNIKGYKKAVISTDYHTLESYPMKTRFATYYFNAILLFFFYYIPVSS